ncbi:MAG: hypothetical protein ACOX64_04905 [Candidatus Merdivicinus sp.]
MADSNFTANSSAVGANCFKEAVCVNAGRIYDSCSSKDCLEDLRVYFTTVTQPVIDGAQSIKCRKVEVLNVFMDVENVPFNKGFYSVDMTYYFLITVDVYSSPLTPPCTVQGIAVFSKKVILYGSEGNVKSFSSNHSYESTGGEDCPSLISDCPTAKVQVVDPIILSCRLCDSLSPRCECAVSIPQNLCRRLSGDCVATEVKRYVYVTIGMFSIVQLEREVQMMIPVYDYSVPDKECVSSADDPCELFRKIKFPVNEFFPPRLAELDCEDTLSN